MMNSAKERGKETTVTRNQRKNPNRPTTAEIG